MLLWALFIIENAAIAKIAESLTFIIKNSETEIT